MVDKETKNAGYIVLDIDTQYGYRIARSLNWEGDFHSAVDIIKNKKEQLSEKIVQYVDPATGETVKGPRYDTTESELKGKQIRDLLLPGIKQQKPHEPMQNEPRDRFQENKNMKMTREKFQQLIKECLSELKSPRERLKESLRPMVEQVLGEIANVKPKDIDKDEQEKVRRGGFEKSPLYTKGGGPERLDVTNDEKLKELETIVNGINKDWQVYWDDHNELNVDAKNLLRVRITPKYENNFDVDAMIKLVDRVRAIGLTWEQVKDFVKANFSEVGKKPEGNKTRADTLREKSLANKVDQDKNKKAAGPDHDLIKNRLEDPEHTKLKDTKKKDLDYKEQAVKKDEDQPDQPMKSVDESPKSFNKDIKKTPQVKPQKHDNSDKALKTSLPKTKKFKKRSSQ